MKSFVDKYALRIVTRAGYKPVLNKGVLEFVIPGIDEEIKPRLYDYSDGSPYVAYKSKDGTFRFEITESRTKKDIAITGPKFSTLISEDISRENARGVSFNFCCKDGRVISIIFDTYDDLSYDKRGVLSKIIIKVNNHTVWELTQHDDHAIYEFNGYRSLLYMRDFKTRKYISLISGELKRYGLWTNVTIDNFNVIYPGLVLCVKDFLE